MELPFGRTKALESQVDAFLDVVAQGVLALRAGIAAYLDGQEESFRHQMELVSRLEHQADELSNGIETALYTYSLIPESRGDVLEVLELIDNLIDLAKGLMNRIDVEQPYIPVDLHPGYLALTEASVNASDHVVRAARCYFRDPFRVKDDLNKVYFYEAQADSAALQVKKALFRTDMDLARKLHLRYFIDQAESLSDLAQDAASLIAIATIKRSV